MYCRVINRNARVGTGLTQALCPNHMNVAIVLVSLRQSDYNDLVRFCPQSTLEDLVRSLFCYG